MLAYGLVVLDAAALGDDERDSRNEGGTQACQGRNHPCGQSGLLALLRRRAVGRIGRLRNSGLRLRGGRRSRGIDGRQRIALARAFLKDAPLLVLDDDHRLGSSMELIATQFRAMLERLASAA